MTRKWLFLTLCLGPHRKSNVFLGDGCAKGRPYSKNGQLSRWGWGGVAYISQATNMLKGPEGSTRERKEAGLYPISSHISSIEPGREKDEGCVEHSFLLWNMFHKICSE